MAIQAKPIGETTLSDSDIQDKYLGTSYILNHKADFEPGRTSDFVLRIKFARDLYENVEELYVVEDTHIEGEMIWQNADGVIFRSFPNGKPEKVADSLLLYLKQLNNN